MAPSMVLRSGRSLVATNGRERSCINSGYGLWAGIIRCKPARTSRRGRRRRVRWESYRSMPPNTVQRRIGKIPGPSSATRIVGAQTVTTRPTISGRFWCRAAAMTITSIAGHRFFTRTRSSRAWTRPGYPGRFCAALSGRKAAWRRQKRSSSILSFGGLSSGARPIRPRLPQKRPTSGPSSALGTTVPGAASFSS